MIFKTINSSVDETRKTLALFNKNWDTYKRNWQNANGVFGKIGSVFTPANAIAKSDIEAIKAYNSQIDSCVTSQTAFNRTMLNASPAAQNLVASYNGGKVSAQGMATAQNAAKASTIGLTIAQTALNAAIGMGISLLVSLVVKGIDKLIHANEEAIEKAEELRNKYEEFKSTNESNVTTLKGLEKEFKELSKGVSQYGDNVSLTTEQYEKYKEIIQQIVGISPSLAEGYSTENGYIADKNGLLERAIELQEQEYRNELRKITNLDNLKTSMSGYIAEYKEAFNGGLVTDDMSATVTREFTDLRNAIYGIFNTNNRKDFSSEDMIKQIMDSIGVKDIENEIAKYYNEYGYFQSQDFWNDYADIIAQNVQVITNSLTADAVGLDNTIFDQNVEKVDSAAQSYLDMKDAISMANESIQRDLGYIAEYADGYSNLSTEQQKFVNEFLKGFSISDIMSESNNPFDQGWKFDEDKMASVKSQITKFVEALSQDETTKKSLAELYAIPTDEQSIDEFIEQFRNALEVVQKYCEENGIEIPIAITDSEQTINDLEAQYQRAVDFAKDKFDGYDPTEFFKEHSINTQEEIDAWQEIAQGARDAAEAEKEYIQSSTSNIETDILLSISQTVDQLNTQLKPAFDSLKSAYQDIFTDDGFTLENVDTSMLSSIKSTIDELNNMEDVDIHVDYSTFEDLAKVLTDSSSTAEDVQNAFNNFASTILDSVNPAISQCDGESYKLLQTLLESMGIVNAEEVLMTELGYSYEEYANAKEAAANSSIDLNNSIDGVATALQNEGLMATEDAQQIMNYMLAKMSASGATIDVSSTIGQLAEEFGWLADLIDQWGLYYSVSQKGSGQGNVKGSKNLGVGNYTPTQTTKVKQKVEIEPVFDGSKANRAAKSAGKSAGKSFEDGLREQLSNLDGVISGITGRIDDQISSINEQKSAALDSIDEQKEALEEAKDQALEAIEQERQARLDAIEEQRKALESQIKEKQKVIDGIQDEIKAMQDANEERKREIDLQKAKYELERMQNQRTKLVNYMPDTIVI